MNRTNLTPPSINLLAANTFDRLTFSSQALMIQAMPRAPTTAYSVAADSSDRSATSVPTLGRDKTLLPPDFTPGPYDVICSRGAAAKNWAGNRRFRQTIQSYQSDYDKAESKFEKSIIVSAVVDSVRDFTPNGGFVKKLDDGFWYEVGDAAAREKIGQSLRDKLHTKYRSSTKAKKPRRKELRDLKKKTKTTQAKKAQPKRREDKDLGPINFESVFGEPFPGDNKQREQVNGVSARDNDDFQVPNLIHMWGNESSFQSGSVGNVGNGLAMPAAENINPLEGDLSLPTLARIMSGGEPNGAFYGNIQRDIQQDELDLPFYDITEI